MQTRRSILCGTLATAASMALPISAARGEVHKPAQRAVPSSGEMIPSVGLGSWITFNVGNDARALDASTQVIAAFFKAGGRMIDSSPMYGSSQATIGHALKKLALPKQLFSAEKVWTSRSSRGAKQIAQTRTYWKVPRFDLMQVHNLVAWEGHLETLRGMKARGELRYIGVTTSHGRRHKDLEAILKTQAIDFVQLTYNAVDRDVERRLLPLARERGVGVIVNRPFQRGALIRKVAPHPLPAWAAEAGASNWAQFLLKFAISHPAVTCAIPATTKVAHVRENMSTGGGPMPDARLRQRMANHIQQL